MSNTPSALYCPWCGTIFAMALENLNKVDKKTLETGETCDFCGDVKLLFLCFIPGSMRLKRENIVEPRDS